MKYPIILCRYLLAFLFIFSGFVKGVDPLGFAYKLTDYFKAFNADSLEPLAIWFSFMLCGAELFVGLLLLFGIRMRLAIWGAFLFMLVFTPLTFILAIFNPVHDCGCFGDAIKLTNWETFFKNLLFFGAALLLFMNRASWKNRSDSFKEFVLFILLIFIALIPPFIGYTRLPIFDFRPYKIGANIHEAMAVPIGAPVDVYKTTLTYQKDGVTKEFNENNIPWQDSTWKFVDSKSELIKKGYTPTIESFNLMTLSGKDISDSILSYPTYYILVVAYRLDRTNSKSVEKLNELYFRAKANGFGFACVTGSTKFETEAFVHTTGAEYPFLNADEIMLKTMIRANPGVILFNKATIIGNWSFNQLPNTDYFQGDLNAKQISTIIKTSNKRLTLVLILSLGLLLALVYETKKRGKK
jgi:uncharacterized membrane protein YphA (DoxX/SURF4 family)